MGPSIHLLENLEASTLDDEVPSLISYPSGIPGAKISDLFQAESDCPSLFPPTLRKGYLVYEQHNKSSAIFGV